MRRALACFVLVLASGSIVRAAEVAATPLSVVLAPEPAGRLSQRLATEGVTVEVAVPASAHLGTASPSIGFVRARPIATARQALASMAFIRGQAGKASCRWTIQSEGADLVPLVQALATVGPCDVRIETSAEPSVLEHEASRLRQASFVWLASALPSFEVLSQLRRLPRPTARVSAADAPELMRRLARADDVATSVEVIVPGEAASLPQFETKAPGRLVWFVMGRWSEALLNEMHAGRAGAVRWTPPAELADEEVIARVVSWLRRVEPLGERKVSDAALDEPLLNPR